MTWLDKLCADAHARGLRVAWAGRWLLVDAVGDVVEEVERAK